MDVELERLESPRVKIQVLVAPDAFTSYGLGWILDSLSSREILTSLVKGWFSVFGSPRRVFSDGAKSLVSEEWHDAMVRWGVVATTSAAQAPWQHGKVEVYIRRVRRFIRAVWRSLGPWPDVSPQECVSLTFSGRNEMDQITEGVSPSQAALGYRPRRFFGDEWDQDWSPIILTDPKGLLEQDIKIRANARAAILREQTLARIDKAVLSKPMQTAIYDPGAFVQIFRETVHQGGRRAGRWTGPSVTLATESSHGGKVPRIVHVAFRNRTWQCAPEQVRPASVEAILARRTLREAQGLSPLPAGTLHYRRDIRHEARSLPAAVEPTTEDEEMNDQEDEPPEEIIPLENIPNESEIADEDELIRELFENDEPIHADPSSRDRDRSRSGPPIRDPPPVLPTEAEAAVQANNILDGVPRLGSTRRERTRSPLRGTSASQVPEDAYHDRHEFYDKEPVPFNKEIIEIALLADWCELREGGRAIETVFESCLVASVAKKRRLEINYRHLSPAEKVGMRAAKRKEFAQWLSSKVLNVATAHGVLQSRVVRCRWVLTFKNVEVDPKAPPGPPRATNIADENIREEYSDLGDGRMCKARLVVLGYEDPDVGEYATYAPTVCFDAKAMVFMISAHRGWHYVASTPRRLS